MIKTMVTMASPMIGTAMTTLMAMKTTTAMEMAMATALTSALASARAVSILVDCMIKLGACDCRSTKKEVCDTFVPVKHSVYIHSCKY